MKKNKPRRVGKVRSLSLFLLAGLPGATAPFGATVVETLYKRGCSAQILAASSSDNGVYSGKYIEYFSKLAADFARKRRREAEGEIARPAFVFLMYVPAPGHERLLEAFDFSVFPVPLASLSAYGTDGKMHRHNPVAVQKAIESALAQLGPTNDLKNRIELARPTDPFMLPPINFHISRADRIAALFLEVRQGRRDWTDRLNEIQPEEFNSDSLVKLNSGVRARHFRDDRGLIFFRPSPGAYHGGEWMTGELSPTNARRILRALYRFGAPLPQGFQHDAQFDKPKQLNGVKFDCCVAGEVLVTASHANVYPDDFIRV